MPFHSSSGSSYRSVRKCRRRHCDKEVAYYQSSDKSSFYCSKPAMLLTNAARLQKTGRGSVNITQFVAAPDAAKEYQTKTNPSVSQRETLRCGFAQSIVAKQMAATNIAATQTPSTVKITPRRTNARLRTALRIEVRNTTATNILVSILTALRRRWPRVGAKENAVTISRVRRRDVLGMWTWIPPTIRRRFAPTIVNARWHDAMVSSRLDRRFVPSMSALFQAAIDPETLIVPLAPGSVTDGFNFRRCPRHICELTGCDREARTHGSISPFCSDHRCLNNDCLNPAKIKHGFCRKDACLKPECGQPKADGYQDYCLNHIPTTPSSRSDYSTPALPPSRSTGSPWGFSSSGSRPYVVYCPKPIRISELLGSSSRSRSRELRYMQMNNAFRDSTPRHQRH
ncbi:unnamed protein product [Fusarium venenatum]|uniref:Uncharacterized protein n=1 Tax=Fusarium venenatum TaxID=56646 RepID=A0A2L2SMT6_9HYPO|nr:uncharacterized protein FVRRES_11297 [Fusarium venenatum]CEI38606.1 unnamed protein product [Fusarium venenatum]